MSAVTTNSPVLTYDLEMECLGGNLVTHTLRSEADDKTYTISRDYWNCYSLYSDAGLAATGKWAGLGQIIPYIWTPRTDTRVVDASNNPIGRIATGWLRSFPITLSNPDGKTVATLNYSGDDWFIKSAHNMKPLVTMSPQSENAKGITPWKVSCYNSSEVDPRLLLIATVFISHHYSQASWPSYIANSLMSLGKGIVNTIWSALCTVASFCWESAVSILSFLYNGTTSILAQVYNETTTALAQAMTFIADDFGTPAARNTVILLGGIALVVLAVGIALGGAACAGAIGATLASVPVFARFLPKVLASSQAQAAS